MVTDGNQGAEETSRPRQANDALIHGLGEGTKCCGVFSRPFVNLGQVVRHLQQKKRKGGVNQHPYLFREFKEFMEAERAPMQ